MSNDIIQHENTSTMMLDSKAIESYKDMAKLMAQASVQVPDHFKGKPADCLAVVLQAAQWRMNPFVVAQKTHIINGTLGYEAQLVNAVVSSSNAIKGRFHYEYQGTREEWRPKWIKENRKGKDVWKPQFNGNACVRAGAVLAGESEITWGEWVYPVDQEIFNSPLWRTNPRQQAGYLAVKFWSRFYVPDVLLGAYTPDELHEAGEMRDINPAPNDQLQKSNKGVMGKLQQAKKQKPKPVQEEKQQEPPQAVQESEPLNEFDVALQDWMQAVGESSREELNEVMADIATSKLPDNYKTQLRQVCRERMEQLK